MMTPSGLTIDAVVPFATTTTSLGDDSTPYHLSLYGTGEPATALLRLARRPMSETDVVQAAGEIVTRAGLVFSRWELCRRDDGALLAQADVAPTAVPPLAPFPCVVRLFGGGTTAT